MDAASAPRTDPPPARLGVEQVTRSYGGVVAVSEVSFDVTAGRVCGLVGPNGAGKTTLINIVSGFDRADAGEVRVDGARITGSTPMRLARDGLLRTFQHAHAFGSLTVRESLQIAAHVPTERWRLANLRGIVSTRRDRQARTRVEEVIELMRLQRWSDLRTAALPYGAKKRLGMGLALMGEPRILLLDEPAAGLNSAETDSLMEDIQDLRASGMTLIVVEHNMPLIMGVSDQVVVLDHGTKIADGTPAAIASDAAVIGAYLGIQ